MRIRFFGTTATILDKIDFFLYKSLFHHYFKGRQISCLVPSSLVISEKVSIRFVRDLPPNNLDVTAAAI